LIKEHCELIDEASWKVKEAIIDLEYGEVLLRVVVHQGHITKADVTQSAHFRIEPVEKE
jgi:hypothetical protein